MATTSFDKDFEVTDKSVIKKFKCDGENPRKVSVKKRDYESDKARGIALLKQQLSDLETF